MCCREMPDANKSHFAKGKVTGPFRTVYTGGGGGRRGKFTWSAQVLTPLRRSGACLGLSGHFAASEALLQSLGCVHLQNKEVPQTRSCSAAGARSLKMGCLVTLCTRTCPSFNLKLPLSPIFIFLNDFNCGGGEGKCSQRQLPASLHSVRRLLVCVFNSLHSWSKKPLRANSFLARAGWWDWKQTSVLLPRAFSCSPPSRGNRHPVPSPRGGEKRKSPPEKEERQPIREPCTRLSESSPARRRVGGHVEGAPREDGVSFPFFSVTRSCKSPPAPFAMLGRGGGTSESPPFPLLPQPATSYTMQWPCSARRRQDSGVCRHCLCRECMQSPPPRISSHPPFLFG